MVASDPALHEPAADIAWTIGQGKHRPMRILRSLTVMKENLVFWLPGMCSSVPAKSSCGDKSTFRKDRQFDCEASERDASQAPSGKRSREIAPISTRAWCFAARKLTGPFDRFNHGSPVRPELSYVFTKNARNPQPGRKLGNSEEAPPAKSASLLVCVAISGVRSHPTTSWAALQLVPD